MKSPLLYHAVPGIGSWPTSVRTQVSWLVDLLGLGLGLGSSHTSTRTQVSWLVDLLVLELGLRVRVRPWVITYLGKNTGFLASWSFKSSDTVSSLATYFSTYADHLSTSTGSSDCSCSVSNNSNVSLQSRLNWKKKKYILLGNFSF